MKTRMIAAAIFAATGAFSVMNCGSDNGMMSRNSSVVVETIPGAGEVAFDPMAALQIRFDGPMDTAGFGANFACIDAMSHDAMHDSLVHGMMEDSVGICDSGAGTMVGGGMMGSGEMHGSGGGMMNGGMMGGGMMGGGRSPDSATFYRRMHERRVAGRFLWNAELDSCQFRPNSPLASGREYVMMIRSMRSLVGQNGVGMMHEDARDMMVRFRTR